jgi:hypothetical protein
MLLLQFNLKASGDARKSTAAVHMVPVADELNHVDAGALINVVEELNRTHEPPTADQRPEIALTFDANPPQLRVYVDTILLFDDETQPSDEG